MMSDRAADFETTVTRTITEYITANMAITTGIAKRNLKFQIPDFIDMIKKTIPSK